jgi:hypothetical protein
MLGKPKVPKDLDCWMVEGFSPLFYKNLERFSHNLYKYYSVNESWELFYDNVRTKVEEILSQGIFSGTKGTFKSFIYGMIRNEATKANSKNKRLVALDDEAHAYMAATLTRTDTPEVLAVKSFREDFVIRARERCIDVDPEVLEGDLCDGRVTSMVFAYLWLLKGGGGRGLRV